MQNFDALAYPIPPLLTSKTMPTKRYFFFNNLIYLDRNYVKLIQALSSLPQVTALEAYGCGQNLHLQPLSPCL
jgi:hypothetical protein